MAGERERRETEEKQNVRCVGGGGMGRHIKMEGNTS